MTPDTPSDRNSTLVTLPTGAVSVTDVGVGCPVVAIHGLPGSVRDFRWLGPCVEGRARLIRVDMPGFGGTVVEVASGTRIGERAEFVVAVAEALGLERFAVLGHSMGGPVATAVAARCPDKVVGLCLISSAGLHPHHILRDRVHSRWVSRGLRVPGLRAALMPVVRKRFVRLGFPTSSADVELLHTMHCVGAMNFATIRRNIALLNVPTFSAWAADDCLIETSIYEALSDACPAGPRLRFASGGHNIQKTQAVELGDALCEWLDGLDL